MIRRAYPTDLSDVEKREDTTVGRDRFAAF
jgi:hypothetical protein